MTNETKFKIGSVWRTRGGWKATVVWHSKDFPGQRMLVVHEIPNDETVTVHQLQDGSHTFDDRKSDLLTPWLDRPVITYWPKWAKAAAISSGGNWHWWDAIPSPTNSGWHSANATYCIPMHPSERPNWIGDWRESLVVREGGE